MITIKRPTIVTDENQYKLTSVIDIDGEHRLLWYGVNEEFSEYLTLDRSDAFVVALLIYAMKNRHDIKCEAPMSRKLFHSLREYLIPYLCGINKNLSCISIDADTNIESYETAIHSGTGISCGVDSLSTILRHGIDETLEGYKVDTLTLFNSGYYGIGEHGKDMFEKYMAQSLSFSNNFGYQFVSVDTNVGEFLAYDFRAVVTYLTCSTVLALQKYFKTYYLASGYPFHKTVPNFESSASYEIMILQSISTESVTFYSGCSGMPRTDKVKYIFDNPDVFSFVYPCLSGTPEINCGHCSKCVRTIMEYDAFNLLDKIESRFDTRYYKKRRAWLLSIMLLDQNKFLSEYYIFYQEIFDVFKKNKKVPFLAWLLTPLVFVYIIFRNIKNKLIKFLRVYIKEHASEATISKLRTLRK